MKNILVLFISLWILPCKAQTSSISEYILEGKQISDLKNIADCGYLKLATVVEFKIINFSDSDYKNKRIGIIIPCIEFYGRDFFKKGKTYILKIKKEKEIDKNKEFDYTLQNKQLLNKYINNKKYWATSIKIAKK